MKNAIKVLISLVAILMVASMAFATQEIEDTCKESTTDDSLIDARTDVDILSASYDPGTDSIEVCAVLCSDDSTCMPGAQYRFHFDYDMEANGMASYLPARDAGSCSISLIGNITGTTSDDTVRFVCDGDGMNYKKVTGPADNCTPVNGDGEFCCTVALSSLVREDGSTVQECDAIDLWIDAHKKGIQDRAPDTDDSDGCSKPTGPDEVLLFTADGTPPEMNCPDDVTIECGDSIPAGDPTVTDQCDDDPILTAISGIAPGECPVKNTISRGWTATDASGNSSSCGQTITVVDTTPPEIACPEEEITIECDQEVPTFEITPIDRCDESLDVTAISNSSPGQCPEEETISRSWTATDSCGNSSSCGQTIHVVDTTPPVINCPEDIEVDSDLPLVAVEYGAPTASDNCDDQPVVTCDRESGSTFGAGETIVNCTASDACGNNEATCQFIVTVNYDDIVAACFTDCDTDYENDLASCNSTYDDDIVNCDNEKATCYTNCELNNEDPDTVEQCKRHSCDDGWDGCEQTAGNEREDCRDDARYVVLESCRDDCETVCIGVCDQVLTAELSICHSIAQDGYAQCYATRDACLPLCDDQHVIDMSLCSSQYGTRIANCTNTYNSCVAGCDGLEEPQRSECLNTCTGDKTECESEADDHLSGCESRADEDKDRCRQNCYEDHDDCGRNTSHEESDCERNAENKNSVCRAECQWDD